MQTEHDEMEIERAYLKKVTELVRERFAVQKELAQAEKRNLMELSRQMYENTVHFSQDFARLTEANQALGDIETRTIHYRMQEKQLRRYERMMEMPYFARIDFTESGYDREAFYIGVGNLSNEEGFDVYVYDWRAPVASMFYRCELGPAGYMAPAGEIKGIMDLKRQYEIKRGQLNYFFDASVNVMDDVLRSVLAKNASPAMRAIVETIQREQDAIIRDAHSDLLMVQGTAGSGKTSVALHRVAYLMYQGVSGGLSAENIMILSPNPLFGKYISGVLPELGEENVATVTFEEIFEKVFGSSIPVGTRAAMLERQMTTPPEERAALARVSQLRLSAEFVEMLNRLIACHENELIELPDLFYNDECIATTQQIRWNLANTSQSLPLAKRLRMVEETIIEEVHKRKEERMKVLEREVLENPEHQFEVKAQARLRLIKEVSAFAHKVRAFTRPSAQKLYKTLLSNRKLFQKLAQEAGLSPENSALLEQAACARKAGEPTYEDCMALLYLQVKLTGDRYNTMVKQVVVDEAQDYASIHYELLRMLLPQARYTVLGDTNQTIGGTVAATFYEDVQRTLQKRGTLVTMKKSFRCSAEIFSFSQRFLTVDAERESFDRHAPPPQINACASVEDMEAQLVADVAQCMGEGFASAAILCRSYAQAQEIHERLKGRMELRLAGGEADAIGSGASILPVYMAKGLEFDCAFLYGVDSGEYASEEDRGLLYIAATRALHRLFLYYTVQPSALLAEPAAGAHG